ncbi:unnamed protein product [Paramecium primaurelia]|uniref:Uncharacterized protein n=1 Tax=Paramecium primaurelia TaxID=5886 RepID=A0A8S1M4G1_PARPR|nr:unnamed protein product [Paramecium primaurelia]
MMQNKQQVSQLIGIHQQMAQLKRRQQSIKTRSGSEEPQSKSLKDAARKIQSRADDDNDETLCTNDVLGCIYHQTKFMEKTTCVTAGLSNNTEKEALCEGAKRNNKCNLNFIQCAERA